MQTEISQHPLKAIGVDGCKGGWLACWQNDNTLHFEVFSSFGMITHRFPDTIIAVDMPIGLPDRVGASGRGPEGLIRPLLGNRKSSVFSIPARPAVYAETYAEACRLAFETSDPPRKISKQGFFLFDKIRQIDAALQDNLKMRKQVFETHPELVFRQLNNAPLEFYKKTSQGASERILLLAGHGVDVENLPKIKGAAPDDMIDAAACLVAAARISDGLATSWPSPPARDSFNIPIAIWV